MRITEKTMKHALIVCTTLALASSCPAPANSADTAYPIAVEAEGIEKADHHIYLDMRVWNCSDKPLTMDIGNLPWGRSLGRGLLLYQAYAGKTIQQVYPIEDFPMRFYDIPAGGSVTGQIALDWYFPDLAGMKDMRGFVVFWVYQPLGEKGAPVGPKFGGMVPMDARHAAASGENRCRPGPSHR